MNSACGTLAPRDGPGEQARDAGSTPQPSTARGMRAYSPRRTRLQTSTITASAASVSTSADGRRHAAGLERRQAQRRERRDVAERARTPPA